MGYKLSVVKTSDGAYLVNHYHKSQGQRFPDFTHAIDRVCMYARNAPDLFREEPALVGLSDIEERIIHDIRALATDQKTLTTQPSPQNEENADYQQGLQDFQKGLPCRPISISYLRGYERGQEAARHFVIAADALRRAPSWLADAIKREQKPEGK